MGSCAKDETRVAALPAETATPPSLTVDYPQTLVVTDPADESYAAVMEWTAANFGRDIVVEYTLEISSQGEISSATDTLSLGSGLTSRTLKVSELNRWATEIGQLSSTEEIFLDLRIAASVALANSPVIDYPDKVYSNTVTIPIFPYVEEVNPDFGTPALYMIGEDFGAWAWDSPDVVTMIPVSDTSNEFWCIRYLTADRGFKWNSVKNWDDGLDFYTLGTWAGSTPQYTRTNAGNVEATQSGLYLIYINRALNRILIEPAMVYGIGPAFEGDEIYTTENPVNLLTEAGVSMVYRGLPYAGRLRMYATSTGIATATSYPDWWRREFTLIDGRIAYRANYGEMTNYGQPAAGDNVLLKFSTRQGVIAAP